MTSETFSQWILVRLYQSDLLLKAVLYVCISVTLVTHAYKVQLKLRYRNNFLHRTIVSWGQIS